MDTTNTHFFYRIRIGVTGHRVLPQDPLVVERVREVLADIERRVKPSREVSIQWEILTSLADGADRLVAREVLSRGDARLRAVIPLAPAEYQNTFGVEGSGAPISATSVETSRREFNDLMADPRTHSIYLHGSPIAEGAETGDVTRAARHEAYREAGEYILRHTDFLIALVDANRPKQRGGTHDMLDKARKLHVPTYVIDVRQPPYPVRRKRLRHFDRSSFSAMKTLVAMSLREAPAASGADDWSRPFRKSATKELNPIFVSRVEQDLIPHYRRASRLAKINQRAYRTTGIAIYLFAILAILLVTTGAMIDNLSLGFFTAEAIALAGIILLIQIAHRQGYHRQWILLRFLTERLRAASFLTAVGIQPSPLREGPAPTGFVAQCDWTAHVFNRIIAEMGPLPPAQESELEARRHFIAEYWVRDQYRWHLQRAGERIARDHWFETIGSWLFYATLITALLHAITHLESRFLRQFATLAALAFPSIGAAFNWFRSHREYERLAARSKDVSDQLMELAFQIDTATEKGMRPVQDLPPTTALENAVRKVDEIMLTESQDWRGLVRFLNVTRPH